MKGNFVADCRTVDPDAAEVVIHVRQMETPDIVRAVRLVVPADLLKEVADGEELPAVRVTP